MRDSSTRSFNTVTPSKGGRGSYDRGGYGHGGNGHGGYDRGRKRRQKNIITIALIAILAVVAVFAVLIILEVSNCSGDKGDDVTGIGAKFNDVTFNENNMRETSKIHEGELILINHSYHYVFPEQAPTFKPTYGNRPVVGKSPTSGRDIYPYYTQTAQNCAQFDAVMLEAFNKMTSDFYSATGNYDLYIHDEDGYRTYDEQASKNSSKPSYYAPAGQSEHHTGMCTDLYYQVTSNDPVKNIDDPDVKDIYQWIYDNAYKYGFILRYPEDKSNITGVTYEPYHFRYVGYAHAYYMEQNDLCLEEYLDLLAANHTKDKALYFEGDNGNAYMVYYVPSSGEYTNVPVAEESANVVCTVSGDNKSGFIVTVELKGE